MTRLEFHETLVELLGSRNVYFQPPSSINMRYPCIIYQRGGIEAKYANNLIYKNATRYLVTVVDPDPDSEIPKRVQALPYTEFVTHYSKDNLNHDIYSTYIL